jgi:hypothetical protein
VGVGIATSFSQRAKARRFVAGLSYANPVPRPIEKTSAAVALFLRSAGEVFLLTKQ